jgi:hypothetical protein
MVFPTRQVVMTVRKDPVASPHIMPIANTAIQEEGNRASCDAPRGSPSYPSPRIGNVPSAPRNQVDVGMANSLPCRFAAIRADVEAFDPS